MMRRYVRGRYRYLAWPGLVLVMHRSGICEMMHMRAPVCMSVQGLPSGVWFFGHGVYRVRCSSLFQRDFGGSILIMQPGRGQNPDDLSHCWFASRTVRHQGLDNVGAAEREKAEEDALLVTSRASECGAGHAYVFAGGSA